MLHRKVTSLFMFASIVGSTWAAPDGLRSSPGVGSAGPVVGESDAPVVPTFVNVRIESFSDGTLGMWGVVSVSSDNGELIEIRFDPEARPWSTQSEPDFVLSAADWTNIEVAGGEDGGIDLTGRSVELTNDGMLAAINFRTAAADGGKGLHAGGAQPSDGPEETAACHVSVKRVGTITIISCTRHFCIFPLSCQLRITVFPGGILLIQCKCGF